MNYCSAYRTNSCCEQRLKPIYLNKRKQILEWKNTICQQILTDVLFGDSREQSFGDLELGFNHGNNGIVCGDIFAKDQLEEAFKSGFDIEIEDKSLVILFFDTFTSNVTNCRLLWNIEARGHCFVFCGFVLYTDLCRKHGHDTVGSTAWTVRQIPRLSRWHGSGRRWRRNRC